MTRYNISDHPKDGYVFLQIYHYSMYVPSPKDNEKPDPRLVVSVLENIAAKCGIEGAKVKKGKIIMVAKRARARLCAIDGTPNEKDVIQALCRLGYQKR